MASGAAASTAFSPCGLGAGIAPTANSRRRRSPRRGPCARHARPRPARPARRRSACTVSKRWRPRSNRMPTRLITTSASRAAASTEPRIAHVGLHRVDLADAAERLQVAGEVRPAHRDADAVVALGQRADQMAAEEARAAEDGDQRVDVGLDGHGSLNPAIARYRMVGAVQGCGTASGRMPWIDKAKRATLCVAYLIQAPVPGWRNW